MKIPSFNIMIPFSKIKRYIDNRGKPKFDADKAVDDAMEGYDEWLKKNRIVYDRQCDSNARIQESKDALRELSEAMALDAAKEIAKDMGYDKIEKIDDPVK